MTACKRTVLPYLVDLPAVHANDPDRYPHLLACTSQSDPQARYSILFRAIEDSIVLWPDSSADGPFLERLQDDYSRRKNTDPDLDADLPFSGGWFLFLAYELAAEIEPRLEMPRFAQSFPVAYAQYCPAAIILDHHALTSVVVAETEELHLQVLDDLKSSTTCTRGLSKLNMKLAADDPREFVHAVKRIHEYILDGDVFQVNLSRSWSGRSDNPMDPAGVYAQLSSNNPAPFAGLSCFAGGAVVSSSPERLVQVNGRLVQTRPIAGTRPRSHLADLDLALSRELIAHPKERAEHIMLIDLERNDLGRVCEPGSVEVNEFMGVESYAHVHHIVSNVRGTLMSDASPVDVIRALFPGGTITGCPKVRCMEIVAELEPEGRGFYTGSMGYLSKNGNMDLNILIRSMFVQDDLLSFRTGAGIVADSDPEGEVLETEAKAKGLIMALTQNDV